MEVDQTKPVAVILGAGFSAVADVPLAGHLLDHRRYCQVEASCPKTRTNSRPASAGAFRIDASTLASPREARMLGHEHADRTPSCAKTRPF